MSELEPSITLRVGNGEIEVTRDNTTLFTFLGRVGINLSMYDHVFITRGDADEEGTTNGMYIFRANSGFDALEEYLITYDYPALLNMREVPQCDQDAFNKMIHDSTNDLDEGVPDSWR